MPPRVLRLSPHTWDKALQRHPFTLVRLEFGARGMPAVIVQELQGVRPEGLTFTTMDLGVPAPPDFWIHAYRTRSGPIQRSGDRPPAGYYLFRHGIIIAHHPAGVRIDVDRVAAYLRERLAGTPDPDMDEQRWVYEDTAQPGAGYARQRSQGAGNRERRGRDPGADEDPRHHHRQRERARPEPPPGPSMPDPYTVLGVSPDCTDQELRTAYKQALKMNHPDRVAHLSPALQAFALAQTQAIREAWERLKGERGL